MGFVKGSCPLGGHEVMELYFRENRDRVLDLAAFLDRPDRAQDPEGLGDGRVRALKAALRVLASEAPDKVGRIHAALAGGDA
jgi:hypothetical protein